MRQTHWIIILSLLSMDILIGKCFSAVTSNKTNDDDFDYDGDEDGKSNELEATQPRRTFSVAPPYFEKPYIQISKNQGEKVVLECNVQNFRNDSKPIMWYKGKQLISMGNEILLKGYKPSLGKNAIQIDSVALTDAGEYICQVLPEDIRLHVMLSVAPQISYPTETGTVVEIDAAEGSSVILNCNLNSVENGVMWYKGDTLIMLGRNTNEGPYESFPNNSIRIKEVKHADVGDYFCENHNKERHRLVLKLKKLQILCSGIDFTNRSMTKTQGASFNCECKSNHPGNVEIKWSLNGARADQIVAKVDNGKIYIDNADSEHEGMYQCLADDKSERPAIAALAISINYEPKVSTHRHHVNTEIKGTAEMYCDYKANPIGIVRWKKNNYDLSYSEKYAIKNQHHNSRNRTILEIKDVNKDDLGEYECHVMNSVGKNYVKVFLMLEPEAPQFEDMEINGKTIKLHWLVRSRQPLSEAILDYKMAGSYTWSTVSMLSTKQHTHGESMWKITHVMELMPGKWHARVKTLNTAGWSKFSAQHDFIIDDLDEDDEVSSPNKEIPPQDMVMAAGVGLGKTNAAGSPNYVQFVPLTVGSLLISVKYIFKRAIV